MTESCQIMPVFMRKINGKYVTESYSNNANIFGEIIGKFEAESYSNDASNL